MKILFVDEPIEETPGCRGSYDSNLKIILVKKGMSKRDTNLVIFHEYVHYFVDCLYLNDFCKHYLNLIWEIISCIIFEKLGTKINSIKWNINYYRKARNKGMWVI